MSLLKVAKLHVCLLTHAGRAAPEVHSHWQDKGYHRAEVAKRHWHNSTCGMFATAYDFFEHGCHEGQYSYMARCIDQILGAQQGAPCFHALAIV